MEISSTLWLPDTTNWWQQQEETHSKYADHFNVASDIFFIIPHGVGVEASFSLGRDVIRWRQSKTTRTTVREKVVVRKFSRANHGFLAGDDPQLDPTSSDINMEMIRETGQRKLHQLAKVHDFVKMGRAAKTYELHRRNVVLKMIK